MKGWEKRTSARDGFGVVFVCRLEVGFNLGEPRGLGGVWFRRRQRVDEELDLFRLAHEVCHQFRSVRYILVSVHNTRNYYNETDHRRRLAYGPCPGYALL